MTNALRPQDVEALLREIRRYLAYVEAFRRESPEPTDTDKERKQA